MARTVETATVDTLVLPLGDRRAEAYQRLPRRRRGPGPRVINFGMFGSDSFYWQLHAVARELVTKGG